MYRKALHYRLSIIDYRGSYSINQSTSIINQHESNQSSMINPIPIPIPMNSINSARD